MLGVIQKTTSLACLLAFVVSSPGVLAESNEFVIRHANVFDGRKLLPDTDVLVRGNQIQKLGASLEAPNVREIDASGHTLLPGFIDAHSHVYSPEALKEALIFGVCTELDMFADVDFVRDLKQKEAKGKASDVADLRSAGTLATAAGGHGTEYGFPIPTLANPQDAQAWVDARIAEGSDYIKVVYDDCQIYGFKRPTLSKETMKAVIDAAHKRGKLAVCHIGSEQDALDAINAGADGLAHLFTDVTPLPDFATVVHAHHAFVVPTLSVLESICGVAGGATLIKDKTILPYLTEADMKTLRKSIGKANQRLSELFAEKAVEQLRNAGIPILAGTDAPNEGTTHGASLHRELELLVRSGMTPSEALIAATSAPAEAFALSDRGSIATGKRADLVLVKGDPTKDIFATRNIVAVWKTGVKLDREAYRSMVEKQNREMEEARKRPAPGSESGEISDFANGKIASKFGAGWSLSTDKIIGGKSTAEIKLAKPGWNGSPYCLEVSGHVAGDSKSWAGVNFSPGSKPFEPANLSHHKGITFWTKGEAREYRLMVFNGSSEFEPVETAFSVNTYWQKITISFADLGIDGHDISSIQFLAFHKDGAFDFMLDGVSLY